MVSVRGADGSNGSDMVPAGIVSVQAGQLHEGLKLLLDKMVLIM